MEVCNENSLSQANTSLNENNLAAGSDRVKALVTGAKDSKRNQLHENQLIDIENWI